jgi:hypothetical protein
MQGGRQKLCFIAEINAAKNRFSASFKGGKIARDPIRRHLAVGVGSQDNAVFIPFFHQPSLSNIHRRATSVAGVRSA